MPNMYTRGILFGKMVVELGDTCTVKNGRHGLSCDLEFKTKVSLFRVLLSPLTRLPGLLFWHVQRARWTHPQLGP